MEIQKKANQEPARETRRARFVRWGAVAAAILLVAGGALGIALNAAKTTNAGAGAQTASLKPANQETSAAPAALAASAAADGGDSPHQVLSVADYDELYGFFETMQQEQARLYGMSVTTDAAVAEEAAAEAPAAPAPASGGSAKMAAANDAGESGMGGGDHSETNVQVQGVDEADVVKTDGKYIYYVAGGKLCILQADGANTRQLSVTPLENGDAWWGFTSELFLLGDRLMLITQGSRMVWVENGGERYEQGQDHTQIRIYDVSDRAKPALSATLGQSGGYVSSRMVGPYVYIVTSQYVWQPVRSQPATFVPTLSADGASKNVAAEDILVYDNPKQSAYTVIGAINLKSGSAHESAKAVFGGTAELYCDGARLLLASSENDTDTTPIAPDAEGRNVQVTTSSSYTRLTLFALDGASITRLAAGSVPGTLLNQFAMDVYQDVLRVVTTVSNWEERVYTDGIDRYEYDDVRHNSLYTLDLELNVLGSIEELAKDEWVESVRFDGDTGYFVTFRQTDPLFTADLRDPKNPRILSTLKIPGFSEYLHVFGNGLLFGIGYEADEDSGRRQGVKLSMFDTANPADVKECAKTVLSADWTVVGSNHKAILVDAEKNLIAFPADDAYYLYRYTAEKGFEQIKRVDVGNDLTSWNLRGLFIDGCFYVLSESAVTVLSLENMEKLAQLHIG